jgi:hypothetical protein
MSKLGERAWYPTVEPMIETATELFKAVALAVREQPDVDWAAALDVVGSSIGNAPPPPTTMPAPEALHPMLDVIFRALAAYACNIQNHHPEDEHESPGA